MNKAQVSITDLFMSITIFIIILAFIIFYWSYAVSRVNKDFDYGETQLRAFRIADFLSKTQGNPTSWENIPNNSDIPSQISSLGLASSDRNLLDRKVINFTRKLSYQHTKDILNIEPFDYNFSIKRKDDIVTLLDKFNIRMAYIAIGVHCQENFNKISNILQCNPIDTSATPTRYRCEEYSNSPEVSYFLQHINDYDVIFWEHPNTAGITQTDWDTTIKNWVSDTSDGDFNTLILADDIASSSIPNILDVSWNRDLSQSDVDVTQAYYTARDTNDERFLIFPPTCDAASPSDPCATNPYTVKISKHNTVPTANTKNYLTIGKHIDTFEGSISRWQVGNGYVYYISQVCQGNVNGVPDDYAGTIPDRFVITEENIFLTLSDQLYSILISKGKPIPTKSDVITVQRDVLFQNKTSVMEFNLWKKA